MLPETDPSRTSWLRRLLAFDRRRWRAFWIILAGIYLLAFFGPWFAIFIPLIGRPLFLAGLMVWFGAHPANWAGHLLMLVFYAAVAALMSWPFRRGRKRRSPAAAARQSTRAAAAARS